MDRINEFHMVTEESTWEKINLILAMVSLGSLVISLIVLFGFTETRSVAWWTVGSTWGLLLFLNLALWPRLVTSREHSGDEKTKLGLQLFFITVMAAVGAPTVIFATLSA